MLQDDAYRPNHQPVPSRDRVPYLVLERARREEEATRTRVRHDIEGASALCGESSMRRTLAGCAHAYRLDAYCWEPTSTLRKRDGVFPVGCHAPGTPSALLYLCVATRRRPCTATWWWINFPGRLINTQLMTADIPAHVFSSCSA